MKDFFFQTPAHSTKSVCHARLCFMFFSNTGEETGTMRTDGRTPTGYPLHFLPLTALASRPSRLRTAALQEDLCAGQEQQAGGRCRAAHFNLHPVELIIVHRTLRSPRPLPDTSGPVGRRTDRSTLSSLCPRYLLG